MSIDTKEFIIYKFLNSLFLGLSVGSIFTIYAPLEPSIYSIGGIALALGMIVVAKFYEKIMNIEYFFRLSLLVEGVILVVVLLYLIKPFGYMSALLIYSGYQLTFVFGSYLIRAETIIIKQDTILSKIDISKQFGTLLGMLISFIFYSGLEYLFVVVDSANKVYFMHYILILVEFLIIVFLFRSFQREI
jgi:hypothetical protein